jgi:hypothetical protein
MCLKDQPPLAGRLAELGPSGRSISRRPAARRGSGHPARLSPGAAAASAQAIEAARRADIELRPFFHSLSEMPLDRAYTCDCPVAPGLSLSGLSLPTSNAVDLAIVEKLKRALWDALGREAA